MGHLVSILVYTEREENGVEGATKIAKGSGMYIDTKHEGILEIVSDEDDLGRRIT